MQLRDYQREAVDMGYSTLMSRSIVYLALQTRTGKTIISLTIAKKIGLPVLFVTKKKAIGSIQRDHTASGYGLDLTVINYEMLKTIIHQKRLIVIDEAHGTGAYPKPSLRAKQLRQITRDCPVIMLSATPTPESHSQIYHQLWCANARLSFIYQYDNFYKWAKRFVNIREKRIGTGQVVKDYSDAIEALIKPELNPIMITLTQEEAGFAQTSQDEVEICSPLPDKLKDIYRTIRKDGVAQIGLIKVIADTAASKMSKLHQLCGGTVIDERGYGRIISPHKIPALLDIVKQHKKLAIYYKFEAERVMITNAIDSDLLCSDWQEFEMRDTAVYLCQFQSGREGINLATASAIVFYNIDHAYLSYEQTRNRIMAMEKTDRGTLYFMLSEGGIEKEILEVVRKKKNFTTAYFERRETKIIKGWTT